MNILTDQKKFVATCAVSYLISFFQLFLFLDSYFWDDWYTYFDQDSFQIRHRIEQSGFNPMRLVVEGFLNENFVEGFRLSIFAFYPIAATGLYFALKKSHFVSITEVRAIVLLFLIAPVVSSRAAIILFMYTSCMAAFFVAWGIRESQKNVAGRLFSIALFTYSFDTASLIPFILVPIGFSILTSLKKRKDWVTWIKGTWDLIVIGPIYWVTEPILNPKVYAERDTYYVPNPQGVARGLVLLLPVVVLLIWGIRRRKWNYETNRGQLQVVGGLLLIWLGAFPYITIGHFATIQDWVSGFTPGMSDWTSRHQLLLPLGIAFLTVGIANIVGGIRFKHVIFCTCIVFTSLNFSFMQEYYLDSLKQNEIISSARGDNDLQKYDFLLIDDQAVRFNARGRSVRTFEWNKILRGLSTLDKTTEVSRFIDCSSFQPEALVTISSTNGRLRALVTRNVGVVLDVRPISICS